MIVAAGMDARAFRLDFPAGTTLFEVDRDDVFDQKEPILQRLRAQPKCDRRVVRIDVSKSMVEPLAAAGFDASRPAAFIVEGLLMYLAQADAERLLESMNSIAAPRSWAGLDVVNNVMVTSAFTANFMKKLAEVGCPWLFGVDDGAVEALLGRHGWQARAVMPGKLEANFGRYRYPLMPRSVPGIPRSYFMTATKG